MLASYGYIFIPLPRLFGRAGDGVICHLTYEAWEANKFNRRFGHHLRPERQRGRRMSDYGAPQQNDQQRNAITMALMNIARPPGKGQLPQMPQAMPRNVSGGLTAIGNSIGSMGQPPATRAADVTGAAGAATDGAATAADSAATAGSAAAARHADRRRTPDAATAAGAAGTARSLLGDD